MKGADQVAKKSTRTRTNRYEGTCARCGFVVRANDGILTGKPGKWIVEHHPGECNRHEDYLDSVHPFSEEAFEAPTFCNGK